MSHGRAPVEMGISVNKTWMLENNISDINVYFKDPINNVPFISPKETYPDYLMYNIFVIFQFKVYDPRFVDDYETVFMLKSSIIEKLQDVDNCRHYSKGLDIDSHLRRKQPHSQGSMRAVWSQRFSPRWRS